MRIFPSQAALLLGLPPVKLNSLSLVKEPTERSWIKTEIWSFWSKKKNMTWSQIKLQILYILASELQSREKDYPINRNILILLKKNCTLQSYVGKEYFIQDYYNRGERLTSTPLRQ